VALMLFHHARSAARETADGTLVPLAEQDRTRWDGAAIAEANRQLAEAAAAARDEPPGPYQLQAAIASVHANAARREDTRWDDIARPHRPDPHDQPGRAPPPRAPHRRVPLTGPGRPGVAMGRARLRR
jgi:hypothetical protein